MRVLTFIRGYYPSVKHGGPPISLKNLCDLSSCSVEYYIVTTNHDMGEKEMLQGISDGWNSVDKAQVLYLPDNKERFIVLANIVDEIRPDIIYLQSLFDKYTLRMLFVAKVKKIPCILATRGELSNKIYKKRIKKDLYISVLKVLGMFRNIVFHATFPDEAKSIETKLANSSNRIFTISNVPSGSKFVLHDREKCKGVLNAVFVSRIVENKNLYDVLVALKGVRSRVIFDIYGFKQDEVYWNKCEAQFDSLPDNVEVRYMGELKHEAVISVVSKYEVLLFPTYSENYGQIIAESIIACCPVVISDRTPWSDVEENGAGIVVGLHDIKSLSLAIDKIADMDKNQYDIMIENLFHYYKKKIDLESLKQQYIKMYETALAIQGR